MSRTSIALPLFALALAVGCASAKKPAPKVAERASMMDLKGAGGDRCDASKPHREISEYDTSGDGKPDVRKVFMALGESVEERLVMICRETDVNGDGRKDVIRYYDDEGRSLREESDRDFDGKMDMALVFQNGKVVVQEIDENRDGKVDTKIFFKEDKPERAERDLAGRSTADRWHPDRWEYYNEDGRMTRMGTDLDGDTKVDRWDRDSTIKTEDVDVPDPDTAPEEATAAAEEAKPEEKKADAKSTAAKGSTK